MKTSIKKNNLVFTAIVAIAMAFNFSSCQKDEMNGPNAAVQSNEVKALRDALINKTNGGKQATAITSDAIGQNNKAVNPLVFKPNANMFGSTYSVWSAKWWTWAMELAPVANHPFNDDAGFDVTMGQTGNVWFLASSFGTVVRNITIPADKALFLGLLNAEASDLEGLGSTYAERLGTANWFADHITPSSLSCTVDGLPVNVSSYRFVSPEFTFNAPSPWIYGATGGNGTTVADGYYVMVKPLDSGSHTIHYTGAFHFTLADDGFDFDASLDVTYNIIQQ